VASTSCKPVFSWPRQLESGLTCHEGTEALEIGVFVPRMGCGQVWLASGVRLCLCETKAHRQERE
jgi:hypothetical protein